MITRYRNEPVRFKTVHAGRRSYKTEFAKRALVTYAMEHPGVDLFFGAPTRAHAKDVAWESLKQLTLPITIHKSETELSIKIFTGSKIWCIGFDAAGRFEGRGPWHGGVLDEFADMDEKVWPETVEPALMDTKGWCWLIGVPAGKNHYFELVQKVRGGMPGWADYSWFSADVVDPVEVESKRLTLDERTFRQELEGSFESYEGRAYVYYDSTTHRKPVVFDPSRALTVACDFNFDPCIWLLGQDVNREIRVLEEIVQHQTDIWKMCGELKRRLDERYVKAPGILFYGDYEHGKTRSVSATASSWKIIQDEFAGRNVSFRLRSHPRIVDRINAVNSKLRNAKGQVLFQLDPKCVELHKDFEMVDLQMLTKQTDVGDRTHASDAVGYWINKDYPVVAPPTMTAL